MIKVSTLAIKGHQALVMTPTGRLIVLKFDKPLPDGYEVKMLDEEPPEADVWHGGEDLVVPVFPAFEASDMPDMPSV